MPTDSMLQLPLPLLLLLLLLPSQSDCANFTVTILIQGNVSGITDRFVTESFSNRIAANWRLLPEHQMLHKIVRIGDECAPAALYLHVCGSSSKTTTSAIIAIGECGLLHTASDLANSMSVPAVLLPLALCDLSQINGQSLSGTNQASDFTAAAAAAAAAALRGGIGDGDANVWLLHDSHQNPSTIQQQQQQLAAQRLATKPYLLDSMSNSSEILQRIAAGDSRVIVLLMRQQLLLPLLQAVNAAGGLHQKFFWIGVDTGVMAESLLPALPTDSNFVLVRSAVTCTFADSDVFSNCNVVAGLSLQHRLLDAIESLAAGINQTAAAVAASATTHGGSCSLPAVTPWAAGPAVYNTIVNNVYNSARGQISYNSSTRHLSSQPLQILATRNEKLGDLPRFEQGGSYSEGNLVIDNKRLGLFPNRFVGFRNATLTLCTMDFPPLVSVTKTYPNKTVEIVGFVRDILDYLSVQMQFNYILKIPADDLWGNVAAGNPYASGCIGEVQNETVVFGATTFTKSSSRSQAVDFSLTLFEDAFALLLPMPAAPSKMWNVFKPLTVDSWVAIVTAMAVASLVTYTLARFSPFSAWNLKLDFAVADEVWLQEYMWSSIGSFLQQGQDFYPFAMSPRSLMAFWWMFTVIIFGAYTADLTSALTIVETPIRMETFAELAAQDAVTPILPRATVIHNVFELSPLDSYKKIMKKAELADSIPECGNEPFQRSAACLSDYTFLLNLARKHCNKVYMAKELTNVAPCGFAYPKKAYYAPLMDYYLSILTLNGAMRRFFENAYINAAGDTSCASASAAEGDAIEINGVTGVFMITGGLYATGVLVLLVELFIIKVCGVSPLSLPFF